MTSNTQVSSARRLLRNTASPFVAQLFGRVLTTGYYMLQVKLLAPDNLGNYIFAGIVQAYALTITDWGLGTMLTREVARLSHAAEGQPDDPARRDAEARLLFGRMLALRLILSLVAQIPFLVLALSEPAAAIWKIGDNGALAIFLLGLALFPNALSASATAVYNAHERMSLPALIGVITALVTVALGVGLMLLGWGAAGLAVAALFATAFQAIVFWRLMSRDFFPPQLNLDLAAGKLMLATAFPLMVNGLLISIFFRFDQIIIQAVRTPGESTTYENAYKVINVTQIIAPSVVLALFPRMARATLHDRGLLVRQFRGAVKALLLVGLPIVAATVVLAEPIIVFITLGKNVYLPDSAYALMILIWYLPLSFINGVAQYVLIALNRQSRLTWAILGGAAFNVVANLIAVPWLGINGAALMTVLSEIVLFVPFIGWTAGQLGWAAVLPGATGLRLGLAGGAMFAISFGLFMLGVYPLLCAVVGVAAYGALLVLLGIISDEERALIRRVVSRRG